MKFEDYMTYIKEGADYSKEIHVGDQVKISTDAFQGYCLYTIEDAPNFETTKNMIITVEYKVGNIGKKILTYPKAIKDEKGIKEMSKSITDLKVSLKEAAANYSNALLAAFEANGFAFLSKSEVELLSKGENIKSEEKEVSSKNKKAADVDLDDLEDLPEL